MTIRSHCHCLAAIFIIATGLVAGAQGQEMEKESFDYSDYTQLLQKHVDDSGMVSYAALTAEPETLHTFLQSMAKLDPDIYENYSKSDKIAFWLNAYNTCTLEAIIDNYPIKPSFFRSRLYPKNSIRQIPGVWNELTFDVMGRKLTLEHIEHKILRKQFIEPRIHMAMVCAAIGCPPLRSEPYLGEKLTEQLDDQARKFLANPDKFRIDRQEAVLYLSPIFKWFAEDFVVKYSAKGKGESAVPDFLRGYLSESDAVFVGSGKFKIKYLKYDWTLNEQPARQASQKNKTNEVPR
jgi:hypothetical protein